MNFDPDEVFRLADLARGSPQAEADRRRAALEQATRHFIRVKVLKEFCDNGGGYVPGDIAGFAPEQAQAFARAGLVTLDLDHVATPEPGERAAAAPIPQAGKLASVRFRMPWEKYVQGDIAGFSPDVAKRLLNAGIAEPVELSLPQRTLRMIRDALKASHPR